MGDVSKVELKEEKIEDRDIFEEQPHLVEQLLEHVL